MNRQAREYFGPDAAIVVRERPEDKGRHRQVLIVPGKGEWRIGCNDTETLNALEYAHAFGLDALCDPMCIHNPPWFAKGKKDLTQGKDR